MRKRYLGKDRLEVSTIGLGCMGMSVFYGHMDDAESIATLNKALDIGVNLLDTADMYGRGKNEELLSNVLKHRRKEVVLATKFGNVWDEAGNLTGISGAPSHVKKACEASLKRLGVDYIDIYYQHRVDSQTPIEETVGAMAELVKEGKVRHLGLSEAGAMTIRRGNKIYPITAVQTEYSLWTRHVEEEVLPACRELGIGFVTYSPLGRGFLTGRFANLDDLEPGDWRRANPRFLQENFEKNRQAVKVIEEIAKAKQVTPSQVALAWLLGRGNDIVPIPGTKHVKYLEDNVRALEINLTADENHLLDNIAGNISGTRYVAPQMKQLGI